jgi:photosystem II stability/assembly factor-like uncharacterized protein
MTALKAKKVTGWSFWSGAWTALAILWVILATAGARFFAEIEADDDNPQLSALHMLGDGGHGWVVGSSGSVLATADGGRTWRSQESLTERFLWGVQFMPDGRRGWAVGEQGTVISTYDGGEWWFAQSSPTRASLHALYFAADGRHGWAVGESGTVIATVNGGRIWALQPSPSQEWLTDVQFAADARRGWVVGAHGLIMTTADGGSTWAVQTSPTGMWLHGLSFAADGRHGWAVADYSGEYLAPGADSPLITTADGGRSWAAQALPARALLHSVHFAAGGQDGFLAGETNGDSRHGLLMATADGGRTWAMRIVPELDDLKRAQFADDGQHIWALGPGTGVLVTADGGRTWTRTFLSYSRLLAPWYWSALLPALVMLLLAVTPGLRRRFGGDDLTAAGPLAQPPSDP